MKTIPDLIPLHDNRPGLRALVEVEIHEPDKKAVTKDDEADNPAPESEANSPAVLDFIASTATLDRYHEVIDPAGWKLASYRRNPVFQNSHNYGDILFTLGRALITEVRSSANGHSTLNPQLSTPHLFQRIEFATEVNPMARIAYGLYRGRFLNAVSVGFIPLRWEDPSPGGLGETALPRRRYLEQELLEVSAVAIPANPDALALGVKSGAVVKADLQDAVELLRAVAGSLEKQQQETATRWMDLARQLKCVMRKA